MTPIDLSNATIEQVSTRKDGTLKIVLSTQELPPEEMLHLLTSYQSHAREEGDLETVRLDVEAGEQKTPSQRLRGVLYALWEKKMKEKYKVFDSYYRFILEQLIDYYKEKINE